MKKKFITKKLKSKKKIKVFFVIFMFFIGIFISYKNLEKSKIEITDKDLIEMVVSNSFNNDNNCFKGNNTRGCYFRIK